MSFLKNGPDALLYKMLNIFNRTYKRGDVPDSFKRSIIFPIYKKGDINCVSNYRGLSFIDCFVKLYTSLLHKRLSNWVDIKSLMNEYQVGFQKGNT